MNQENVITLRSTFKIPLHPNEAQNLPYLIVGKGVETIVIGGYGGLTGFKGYSTLPHNYEEMVLDGGNVVVDHATDLMWLQSGGSEALSKVEAKKMLFRINAEAYAGHSDWRFPTLEEAASLLEQKGVNEGLIEGLKINPVFHSQQSKIWTGDIFELNLKGYPWYVDFRKGGFGLSFEHHEIFLRPARSTQVPAKNFNFWHELKFIVEETLGRGLKHPEDNFFYGFKGVVENDTDFILDARPYELEKYFRNWVKESYRRKLNLIDRHSENFEKLSGRPLNEIEISCLSRMRTLEEIDEIFKRVFDVSSLEDALEVEIGWMKKEAHVPPLLYDKVSWMGKKLLGQNWAFHPAGRVVQVVHNDEEGIEKRTLQFWESFEKLKPSVVQVLSETLPEKLKIQAGTDYFNHLDSIYFIGKLKKYLKYFGSDTDYDDPKIELCFHLGDKGYLVGVKVGEVVYVDQRNFKTGKSPQRLWGKGEESCDAQGKRKAAQPKWKIERVAVRTRDSYFESDVQYEFQVTKRGARKPFVTFYRSEYSDDRGDQNSGCRSVNLSEDGKSVIATHEDGTREIVILPE